MMEENGNYQEEVESFELTRLPEELMVILFSYFTTRGLHALFNMNLRCRRILDPNKWVWSFDEVFPLLFPYLDKGNILKCRKVCKSWRNVVDSTLQSTPLDRRMTMYPEETGNQRLYAPRFQTTTLEGKGFFALNLNTPSKLRNRLSNMSGHNPIILRSVLILNRDDSEDYWIWALAFLRRFGHEVWHLRVISHRYSTCSYDMLRDILCLVPNLRTLRLNGIFDGNLNPPLPSLPQLRTLRISFRQCHPNRILGELLRSYSGQLKLIVTSNLSLWGRINPHFIHSTHIEVDVNDDPQTWRRFCSHLVDTNLAKLTLHIQDWNLPTLLEPMHENLKSLEYLALRFYSKPDDFGNTAAPTFQLESVKTLEVYDSKNVPYNQLFQCFPRLEYLLVCKRGPRASSKTPWKIFNWIQGTCFHNSNIWDLLPALKEVTLAETGWFDSDIKARNTFTRSERIKV